jgi:hypothetical protein
MFRSIERPIQSTFYFEAPVYLNLKKNDILLINVPKKDKSTALHFYEAIGVIYEVKIILSRGLQSVRVDVNF